MPAKFTQARAVKLIQVNDIVVEQRDPFGERYLELMENPEQRNIDIMRRSVGYLAERYAEETGDPEAAAGYAADLASFVVQPFSAIAAIPLPVRGSLHSDGAALVSEISRYQAWTETTAIETLEVGTEMAKINAVAARRMTTAQKETMSTEGGIKETIAQMGTKE